MKRLILGGLLAAACAANAPLRAFVFIDDMPAWPDGTVTLEMQLGGSTTYTDGTTPNQTAIKAVEAWNPYMKRVQLGYVNNSSAAKSKTNGKNNVFFNSTVYGTAFGDGVLAVTIGRANTSGPIEMDVVVNSKYTWDSYRGYLQYPKIDLRRVLAHEFGHVLGLDHPDDHGQWTNALMNSTVSDLETTQTDDQDGVGSRYGRGIANPAVAPLFSSHPYNTATTEGQTVYFSAYATGTDPITFQWLKDGEAIPGANQTSFTLAPVRLSDAGKYALRATNEAGSATSNEATLSVAAAQVPVFQTHPADKSVEQGAELNLNGWATSNTWIAYQWTKDGVNIPNATESWLRIYVATTTDAGVYRLIATTAAGSVTSNPATITIIPAKPPVFQNHPTSTSVIIGQSAYLSAYASSATQVTYQWTHDDIAIPYATSTNLSLYNVKATDAGAYRLVATNVAGAVTSEPAYITVNPLPPPAPLNLYNTTIQVGSSFSFYTSSWDSGNATTYQWYRNGVPIPGATGYSFHVYSATFADAGEYFVVVTNPSGSTTSTIGIVSVSGASTVPTGGWKQAVNGGDVVYFLFENPARVERFDLVGETWLSPLTFGRTPVAMTLNGPDTAIVAFYRTLSRIDLATGRETPILTIDCDPVDLGVHNGRVYIVATDPTSPWYRRLGSVDLASPALPVWTSGSYYIGAGLSIDRTHGRAFTLTTGISPSDICFASLNADGSIGTMKDSPYHGAYQTGSRTWVGPSDTLVYDNAGTVYSTTDLTFAGTLGGSYESLTFRDDGSPLVLRGRSLVGFSTGLAETGKLVLSQDAHHVVASGDAIYLFTQPSGAGSTISWTRKSVSDLAAPMPLPAIDPATLAYSADDLSLDRDGNILLFSRLHGNVFRWSTSEQRYLESLPLVGRPNHVAVARDSNQLYSGYADGRLRTIDLDQPAGEVPVATLPGRITGLCDAGAYLLSLSSSGSSNSMRTYAKDGTLIASRDVYSDPRSMVWNPSRSRVYQIQSSSLAYTEIGTDGKIGTTRENYMTTSSPVPPVRLSPSGEVLLLGNGRFYNADTLVQNNELPHSIQDAAWVDNRLCTVRDTLAGAEIKRWGGANYGLDATTILRGRCLRLLPAGPNRLLAVTQKDGRIHFTLLDADLKVRNHIEDTPDLTKVALTNLSTRAEVGTGDNIIIAGFVVTGSQSKRILVRAIGPGLDRFGVSGTLADPMLTLLGDSGPVAENDNWFTPDGEALKLAFKEVFAFGLADTSLDSALVATLAPGKYTAQVSGKDGGRGVALVEAYDLDADPGERRLINISTRAVVGIGDKVLIPGLAVEGAEPKRLLIRAVGPELARFTVAGFLADPQLKVLNADDEVIAANDNWGDDNTDVTVAATSAAKAFRLTAGGRDAALVATLPPGSYTVVVSGVGDTSGVALVEIYEVP